MNSEQKSLNPCPQGSDILSQVIVTERKQINQFIRLVGECVDN